MKQWTNRVKEEANLFNPAFCSINIASVSWGYYEASKTPLPFALAFMVLPITLHKPTRELLPRTSATSMPAWLQKNSSALIGFYERLMALKPYTKEALHYGLSYEIIAVTEDGSIECINSKYITKALGLLADDAKDCIARGRILGKWFGATASTETIMTFWGIRP